MKKRPNIIRYKRLNLFIESIIFKLNKNIWNNKKLMNLFCKLISKMFFFGGVPLRVQDNNINSIQNSFYFFHLFFFSSRFSSFKQSCQLYYCTQVWFFKRRSSCLLHFIFENLVIEIEQTDHQLFLQWGKWKQAWNAYVKSKGRSK